MTGTGPSNKPAEHFVRYEKAAFGKTDAAFVFLEDARVEPAGVVLLEPRIRGRGNLAPHRGLRDALREPQAEEDLFPVGLGRIDEAIERERSVASGEARHVALEDGHVRPAPSGPVLVRRDAEAER